MALNGASTINIRVKEKLKNITVGNTLSDSNNFLFALHMIFEAPRFADILFVPSQKRLTTNPKQMPWTNVKIFGLKIEFARFSWCCGPMLTLPGIHYRSAAQGVHILP